MINFEAVECKEHEEGRMDATRRSYDASIENHSLSESGDRVYDGCSVLRIAACAIAPCGGFICVFQRAH